VVQGLAEPRGVEQPVVGGRTDHHDRHDPLRLPAEIDPALLGQEVDGDDRPAQRAHAREQHEERQQRRAVDDHQDHEHCHEGHDQQQPVDTRERRREVRHESRRTGHGHRQSLGGVLGQSLAQVFDHGAGVRLRAHQGDDLHGLAVLARDGRGDLQDVLDLTQGLRVRPDRA